MTRKFKLMKLLPIAFLVSVSACDKLIVGDFCDVVEGPLEFETSTAALIVRTDRNSAEQIDAQNSYGREKCKWPD